MTPEFRRQLGARRAQVSHLLKHEMRIRGYTLVALAQTLSCSVNNVSRVISGSGHSPLVLNGLRAIGVPEELLFDPCKVDLLVAVKPKKVKAK